MGKKLSVPTISAFGVLALIAVTLVPVGRSDDSDTTAVFRQASAAPSVSAPIILAGRCYNRRCF
jgi:hypothetical protein